MPKAGPSQIRKTPFFNREGMAAHTTAFSYGAIIARQKARGLPYRFRTETYTIAPPDRPGLLTITQTFLDAFIPSFGGWVPMRGNRGYARRIPLPA